MKKLIIALIATLGIFTADTVQAEGKSFVRTSLTPATSGSGVYNPVATIPAGKYAKLQTVYKKQNNSDLSVYITIDSIRFPIYVTGNHNMTATDLLVVGPAVIELYHYNAGQQAILVYELFPNLSQ